MTTPQQDNAAEDLSQPEGEEVDWKTRYEESQQDNQRLTKEAQDATSQRIGTLKQGARDDMLTSLDTRVGNMDQQIGGIVQGMGIVLEAINSSDPDALKAQYNQLQQTTQQSISSANWDTYYASRAQDFLQLSQDTEGKSLVDLNADPTLESVRQQWTNAKTRQDRTGIEAALSQAKDVIYSKRLEQAATNGTGTNGKTETTPAGTEQDQQEPEADLFSTMDTGNPSGGRGAFGSKDQVLNAYLSNRIDTQRYEQERRRLGF